MLPLASEGAQTAAHQIEEYEPGRRYATLVGTIEDSESCCGGIMFTLIGAMAELESSLISERVTAGMKAAKAKGKYISRPRSPQRTVARIETLARTAEMSVRHIHREIGEEVGRSMIGNIVREIRQTVH